MENIPLPCDSHANNFLLFLFAHQTHAARLLFSLSSPQYFMPLKVHLFSAFPMPYHLLSKHNFLSFDTPPPPQPSLCLSLFQIEAIMCIGLTLGVLNELFFLMSEPQLGFIKLLNLGILSPDTKLSLQTKQCTTGT